MAFETEKLTKFQDPDKTVSGDRRARVAYQGTKTLWFNTGTLCNIACANCYIESSPNNDRLVYLTLEDVLPYLDELDAADETAIEIGFTGGEPFMAPDMIAMMEAALMRGHSLLVLTNAMQPMMRPKVQDGLRRLVASHGDRITMRISLDHYLVERHDQERGAGAYDLTLKGMRWLSEKGFKIDIAGRIDWHEDEATARAGYARLIEELGLDLDASDQKRLVLFPEMEPEADPPEISEKCWSVLNKHPEDQMCANQRMVVKRKGEAKAKVVACTLLPYDKRFELGETLSEARGEVSLNHSYCASFCVLGGGSCSA